MNQQPQPSIALPPDVAKQQAALMQKQQQVQNLLINLSSNVLCQLVSSDTWHHRRSDESPESHQARLKKSTDATAFLAAQYAGSLLETLGLIVPPPAPTSPLA